MKPTIEEFMHILTENIDGLEPGSLRPDTNYKDTDVWDSMNALLIMALLETEFNVSLSVQELKNCATVEDLYVLIP